MAIHGNVPDLAKEAIMFLTQPITTTSAEASFRYLKGIFFPWTLVHAAMQEASKVPKGIWLKTSDVPVLFCACVDLASMLYMTKSTRCTMLAEIVTEYIGMPKKQCCWPVFFFIRSCKWCFVYPWDRPRHSAFAAHPQAQSWSISRQGAWHSDLKCCILCFSSKKHVKYKADLLPICWPKSRPIWGGW